MMRYLRAITATFALLALLTGLPVLLALTVGNPLASWPDLLAGDLSDTVLVGILAAVAYLAWAQFAVAVIAETLSLFTGLRPPSRLFIVSESQRRLARALLAAAFLLSPAASSGLPASASQPAQIVATGPLAVTAVTTSAANGFGATSQNVSRVEASNDLPTYTIRTDGPGTFWDLAEYFLGDGQRWPEIWRLNDGYRQADGTVMTSPGLLRPGWTVRLPASAINPVADTTPVTDARTDTPGGEVIVEAGDSLWAVAEEHLGDGRAWPELYQLNHGQAQPDGRRLIDPDLIQPGWILDLPRDQVDDDTPSETRPEPNEPDTTQPPTANPTPASPVPTQPGTSIPSTVGPSATDSASGNGTDRSEPTASATHSPTRTADSPIGVDLPGGWVTIPFAAAVSAAGATVWLRRRRRYRYTSLEDLNLFGDSLDPDDPDLQPLPAIVHRMRRAVREHAPRLLDPPPSQPTVTEYVADPTRYRPAPKGPTGPELTGLTDLAHPDGLGLTGPGADAAARALLVAVLAAGGPQDPDASGQLVIPSSTLQSLLGDGASEAREIPRLRVTEGLTEALDLLEQEHLQCLRTLDEYDVNDITQLRASDPAHPLMPPVVLLTHTPPEDLRTRLIALMRLGTAVDIRAVLLGDWPPGATVELANDGTTTIGTRSHRVASLDVPSVVELLQVLHEAQTGELALQQPTESTETDDTRNTDIETPDPVPGRRLQVAVRVLGHIAVLDEQGKPVPGLRQHAGGLLVYLVIHRTGADKNDIMEALWPEASLRRAAERLSTEVGNLRRCIRQAAIDQDIQPVINTGGRYHLDPSLVDVDAWTFQDALHRATTTTAPAARQEALHVAISAHAGPLAESRDYHWLEPAREQIRRNGIRARLHLADLVSVEDQPLAAGLTRAAADLDPTNEELARLAMGAHARVGDTLAVTARLRNLRSALREIDEEPSQETLTLATHLQQRDVTATSSAATVT